MSEYWVSKKRYFCKYCDIYIADDAPSRQHHENGLRHKGNVDRFVRGLYKAGEKRKKDADEERREIARIEQAAQAAFSQDVGAGLAKASSSKAPAPAVASSSRKPLPKSKGGFADYSTAQQLGYTDPDVERALAEKAYRQNQGVAGEWHFVDTIPKQASQSPAPEANVELAEAEAADEASRKRAAEEPVDEEDGRGWKLRKKTVSVGLGEIYDPGVVAIKVKPKKEEPQDESKVPEAVTVSSGGAGTTSKASTVPKWTAVKWKKAGEAVTESPTSGTPGTATPGEAVQEAAEVLDTSSNPPPLDVRGVQSAHDPIPAVKEESTHVKVDEDGGAPVTPPQAPSTNSLFRKRRAPAAGGATSRGRSF
ncbi:hypothetical protein BV25DRAFT_1504467 [Artomyces pyxidatus]|uniref:Uncharacterized protein n=1 Tax=Artomyces pyxidatus TaxID=48021 RepID=A0ACB8TC28_9AGAM|nr:hypothetical protein BV25DRAFT_1504467 [Artomyces pyxidatus]